MTLNENYRWGLDLFSQLVLNKQFLIQCIHTLEPTFTLQDRIQFASYLSICLHDRLDYFTDILTMLLAELIESSVSNRVKMRTIFRRNECVAEKMLTNWLTFLLYDYIKDCVGTPLYILFLSLKQQIYKGPVDAITVEARFSLNQQNLIHENITYETIVSQNYIFICLTCYKH